MHTVNIKTHLPMLKIYNMKFIKGHTPWNKDKKLPEMSAIFINNFGNKRWCRGKKHTQETIEKMKKVKRGRKRPDMMGNKWSIGTTPWNKGKKMSQEEISRQNQTGLKYGRGWNKGMPATWASGEKNNGWKGGITPLHETIRKCPQSRQWRERVFKRDNWTCQNCYQKGGKLHADHIKPFAIILHENKITSLNKAIKCKKLWDVFNGRTLCIECHKKTNTYGGKTRTPIEPLVK